MKGKFASGYTQTPHIVAYWAAPFAAKNWAVQHGEWEGYQWPITFRGRELDTV